MTDRVVPERVGDTLHALGESPVWSARDRALWYVDLRACALHRFDPANGARRHWTSSMRDYGAARTGAVYRVGRDRRAVRMLFPVTVPNGLVWSPDGRTMYFADSADGRLRAYEFDPASGDLGAMRILCDSGIVPGKPDGAAVDADDCVWSARYGGGCVARITPRGDVDRVVALPVSQVASCAFGDDDLRTLYITTARQRLDGDALAREPWAGGLFAVRLPVGGVPETPLAI